jgi:hypothetical protein
MITATAIPVVSTALAAAMRTVMATPVLARQQRHQLVEHRLGAAAKRCHSTSSSYIPVGSARQNRGDAVQPYGSD